MKKNRCESFIITDVQSALDVMATVNYELKALVVDKYIILL
jgi:hypothetical protein